MCSYRPPRNRPAGGSRRAAGGAGCPGSPIAALIAASNIYSPEEIPPISEIFHPKDWQLRLILDNGAEVTMEVRHIREQMDRLALILEHARATHRRIRSINVIPALNPTVIFEPANSP